MIKGEQAGDWDVVVGGSVDAIDEDIDDPGLVPLDTLVEPEDTGTDLSVEPDDSPSPPTYPHFDTVIDLHRGDVPVWAHLIHVEMDGDDVPVFHEFGYGDTAEDPGFWPASTIKIYPATAALTILKEQGFSLDAKATFYHETDGAWIEDITKTFREMIFESFNCSSNSAYTLLLRFAGVDWINQEFFTAQHGFDATTLMVGYVNDRPWVYKRSESQRIVVTEGEKTWERIHDFSGSAYHKEAGCTVVYGAGAANCSSPRDMTEHMKRVMFHESFGDEFRFDVRVEDLDWMRYEGAVMNNKETCGSHGWAGVQKVFPNAEFYHKGGAVSGYRLDLHYVEDSQSETSYILAVATESGGPQTLAKLSEEIARMVKTPGGYVHLENLKDNVNPVSASLVVYSAQPASLNLRVKDFDLPVTMPEAWQTLPGASADVEPGITSHTLTSECLTESGKLHVRGHLDMGALQTNSDLHYVIVDAGKTCP